MSTTRNNTNKGDDANTYKGGVGIDGNKHAESAKKNFTTEGQDWDAVVSQFGRSWLKTPTYGSGSHDCSYGDEGESGSVLLDNARIGQKPLIGKGDPTSPIQTGMRTKPRANDAAGSGKRRFSGAF